MDLKDYTPPQFVYDLLAEQALLKIALHGDAYALQLCGELGELMWSHKHRQLAIVMSTMHLDHKLVDPVSVLAALASQGLVSKIDGPFLHGVYAGPGEHVGVRQYGDRIRKLAARRVLREVMVRGTQALDYAWGTADDDLEQEQITQLREDLDQVEVLARPGGSGLVPEAMSEFLLGPTDFNWIVPGLLEKRERMIITGSEGTGKANCVKTLVPTPSGLSTVGDLLVGDQVFSPDGSVVRVVAATEVMHGRPCYRVTFSDGAQVVADAEHLWLTETLKAREAAARAARRGPTRPHGTDQRHRRRDFPQVVTTAHIAATVTARQGHAVNHSVTCCAPLDPPAVDFPIDPYLLGVWLGDGATGDGLLTLNRVDAPDIERMIRVDSHRVPSAERPGCVGVRVPGFAGDLREAGFLGYKHIPTAYLRGSAEQRWALLAGLMDTDGHIAVSSGTGRGHGAAGCELTLCDKTLAGDALELLWSLGIKVAVHESDAVLDGRVVGRRWRMWFQTERNPFRVPRKASRWQPLRTRRAQLRYITSVEPVDSVPVRCIQVDRPDGMFVIGRECIPTHNSVLTSQLASCMAGGIHPFTGRVLGDGNKGIRVTVIDCENNPVQSRRRFLWVNGKVDKIRRSLSLPPVDWKSQMSIAIHTEGFDLLKPADVAQVAGAIEASKPDLLVLGPLYKLFEADPSDETACRKLIGVLDRLRARYGFALLTEAHPGKSEDGGGNRRMAPIGSSLWLRWPEYGFGLRRSRKATNPERAEIVDVVSWRGTRESRQWPAVLEHGERLPWMTPPERPSELLDQEPDGWSE